MTEDSGVPEDQQEGLEDLGEAGRQYHAVVNHADWSVETIIQQIDKGKGGRLTLAIGAPSSPGLSNALMFDFDSRIADEVEKDYVTYTRYADDLTFSAERTGYLNGVDRVLRRVIREMDRPSLELNDKKTVRATKKYKRCVTGLILTNDGKVSIGQNCKRSLRAGLHHFVNGRLSPYQQARLAGKLAFVFDVEPELFYRIQAKYGAEIITQLRAVRASRPETAPIFDDEF